LRLFTALFQSILICCSNLICPNKFPAARTSGRSTKKYPRSVRQSPSKAPVPCPALAFRYPKPPRRTARAASGFITGPPYKGRATNFASTIDLSRVSSIWSASTLPSSLSPSVHPLPSSALTGAGPFGGSDDIAARHRHSSCGARFLYESVFAGPEFATQCKLRCCPSPPFLHRPRAFVSACWPLCFFDSFFDSRLLPSIINPVLIHCSSSSLSRNSFAAVSACDSDTWLPTPR
jgi:hypothetical protein